MTNTEQRQVAGVKFIPEITLGSIVSLATMVGGGLLTADRAAQISNLAVASP